MTWKCVKRPGFAYLWHVVAFTSLLFFVNRTYPVSSECLNFFQLSALTKNSCSCWQPESLCSCGNNGVSSWVSTSRPPNCPAIYLEEIALVQPCVPRVSGSDQKCRGPPLSLFSGPLTAMCSTSLLFNWNAARDYSSTKWWIWHLFFCNLQNTTAKWSTTGEKKEALDFSRRLWNSNFLSGHCNRSEKFWRTMRGTATSVYGCRCYWSESLERTILEKFTKADGLVRLFSRFQIHDAAKDSTVFLCNEDVRAKSLVWSAPDGQRDVNWFVWAELKIPHAK